MISSCSRHCCSRARTSHCLVTLVVLLTLCKTAVSVLAQEDPGGGGGNKSQPAEAATADATRDVETAAANARKSAVEAVRSGNLVKVAGTFGEVIKTYAFPAVVAVVVLIVAYFLAAFLARLCSAPVRARVDETLGRFVGKLVFYLVIVCAVLGVLQYFGIGVTSFAAVLAAAGFAVGLAFQGTLSNVAAGVLLLVFRPFKVGDFVTAAGTTGTVYEIDLFATTFDTPDNRRVIVPNSAISSGTIENITYHPYRRVDVSVGVDYSADLQRTREALAAAAESIRKHMVEGESFGYQVVLTDLGSSAVGWTVRFWARSADFGTAKEDLTAAIKNQLDRAGIGIPFPQLQVHVDRSVAES